MKKHIIWMTLAGLVLGCSVPFSEEIADTPRENFEYLWNRIDRQYSFFKEKEDAFGLNWNDVKTKYSARINDGMTKKQLFSELKAMVEELRDGHSDIISYFDKSIFNVYDGVSTPWEYEKNLDFNIVLRYYLKMEDMHNSGQGTFIHGRLQQDNSIAYVRYPGFNGKISANKSIMDFVIKTHKDAGAMIFDLRENGGGSVGDIRQIVSRFIDTRQTVGYVRDVNGPDHNSFSDFAAVVITPYGGERWPTNKKVILLTDRGTYSAGSFTTLFMKDLPNVTTVGDDTGGGLGLPRGGELPNGWAYRFSVSQTADLNKEHTEYENGVPVEEKVNVDKTDPTKDEIIDKAIELINQ